MPYTLNGVGTWYWGKRDLTVKRGRCDYCGEIADLRSYDTTLFFVVLFVPLFPLSSSRVIDECGRCRRHRVVSLQKWKAAKAHDLQTQIDTMRADPRDPRPAAEAVKLTAAYDDKAEFLRLAATFPASHAQDPSFLAVLGDAYVRFGMLQEGERAYRASFALREDDAVENALAVTLLKLGRLDEARPIVDSFASVNHAAARPLVYLTVEAYQAAGRHADALALLNESARTMGELRVDREFQEYVTTSNKHLASGKRIKSGALSLGTKLTGRSSGSFNVARLIPVAVIAAVVCGFLLRSIYLGSNRDVWVVNGTSQSYRVSVAGQDRTLLPASATRLTIPEGTHQVIRQGPGSASETVNVTIETNFWTRAFYQPTFVVNPDRLAFLVWEEYIYAQPPRSGAPNRALHSKTLHEIDDIDHAFQPAPANIKAKAGSVTTRHRIDIDRTFGIGDRLSYIENTVGRDAAIEMAKRGIIADPMEEWYILYLQNTLSASEIITLVEPLLSARPILIHAHRAYQDASKLARPSADLADDYARLLATEPKNASLAYLAGRSVDDVAESRRLFMLATQGDQPEPLAFRALGYSYFAAAEFEQTCAIALAAREKNIADEPLYSVHRDALMALGQNQQALDLPEMQASATSLYSDNFRDVFALSVQTGNRQQALDRVREAIAKSDLPASDRESELEYYTVMADEIEGIVAAAPTPTESVTSAPARYRLALERGQWEIARAAIEGSPDNPTTIRIRPLILCSAALARDDSAAFNDSLEQWIVALGNCEHLECRELAKSVKTDAKRAFTLLPDWHADPIDRAMAYVVVAQLHPSVREECVRLARAFNFRKSFPAKLVNAAIERVAASGAPSR